jgi:hypothetical protein
VFTFLYPTNLCLADYVVNLGLSLVAAYLANSLDRFPISLGHRVDCGVGVFEDVQWA